MLKKNRYTNLVAFVQIPLSVFKFFFHLLCPIFQTLNFRLHSVFGYLFCFKVSQEVY